MISPPILRRAAAKDKRFRAAPVAPVRFPIKIKAMPAFIYYQFPLFPLVAALGVAATLALAWATWNLRAATLRAPLVWAWIAWLYLNYLGHGANKPSDYETYTAAVLSIAPLLAVLGAKRPQNGAWQFIVLTLVAVLLLPVGQGWAYGDAVPHVHGLFQWLIAAHILLAVANYFATRFRGSALVYAVGAVLSAGKFLPVLVDYGSAGVYWALLCFPLSILGAAAIVWRSSRAPSGLQHLWLDFRDAYGAVWALRVAERLNAAARMHRWPVEFTWSGILVTDGANTTSSGNARPSEAALEQLDPAVRHRVERELRSLLRRFVSHEWIVKRLGSREVGVEVSGPRD